MHLGVASHNLFDVAYGLVLRAERGREPRVEFEMLEGMANHQARVVQARAGGLLLYAPVVRAEDFHSAIAYLVRRLDENTAPDNFLRHVFGLEPGSPDWDLERDRFLGAFDRLERAVGCAAPHAGPRGRGRRRAGPGRSAAPFANEPDTDWALAANREWIDARPAELARRGRRRRCRSRSPASWSRAPCRSRGATARGPARVAYRHALADRAQVSRALDAARAAQAAWGGRPAAERRALARRPRRRCSPGARRPDRRHDRRRRQDRDRGRPRGLRGDRLRALLRARRWARATRCDGARLEPLGVVVVTPPWNFPLAIPAGGVLAALVAGNAVLLKPAPETVLVGWHLAGALLGGGHPA